MPKIAYKITLLIFNTSAPYFSTQSAMRTLLFLMLPFLVNAQKFNTTGTTNDRALSAYREGMREASFGPSGTAVAQGFFEKAVRADPLFIEARLALADTYRSGRDFFKAREEFLKAIELDSTFRPLAFLILAEVEWDLDMYDDCTRHATSYLNSNPINPGKIKAAKKWVERAQFASRAIKNPVPFNPVSLGPGINTDKMEYFPSLTADGSTMIFTRRVGLDENFYSSTFNNGKWETAVPIDGVNTPQNEGAQAISPDGSWLVFTACNRENDGSQGSCDLYWSQLKNGAWSKPTPFSSAINSPDWEAQPTIGADNKTIIFCKASSRDGSRISLWQTNRQQGGKWSKPEKLPEQINAGGRVIAPFLHPDGQTLYFASDSLPGLGGSDLFFVRKQPDGSWGSPVNLGYPINTKGSEEMLVVSLDGKQAFFAANRSGGAGGLDIYSFEMPEAARPQPVTYARARITDAVTGYPLVAKADFTDIKTGLSFVSSNSKSDGTVLVCLPAGKSYALNVSREGYLFHSENFDLLETATAAKPFELDIALIPFDTDTVTGEVKTLKTPIALRNVFFETGASSLKPESAAELDRLAELLEKNPLLNIQINGHTDNVGNDESNMLLSEKRAKAVYDYLVTRQISPQRLRFRGYGKTQPIDTNDTPEGRSRNRRTEFEVW